MRRIIITLITIIATVASASITVFGKVPETEYEIYKDKVAQSANLIKPEYLTTSMALFILIIGLTIYIMGYTLSTTPSRNYLLQGTTVNIFLVGSALATFLINSYISYIIILIVFFVLIAVLTQDVLSGVILSIMFVIATIVGNMAFDGKLTHCSPRFTIYTGTILAFFTLCDILSIKGDKERIIKIGNMLKIVSLLTILCAVYIFQHRIV